MKISDYDNFGFSPSIGEESIEEAQCIINIPDSKMTIYAMLNINKPAEPYFRIRIWEFGDEDIFISRLSMVSPKYIKTDHEDYELSNDEIDILVDCLNNTYETYYCFSDEEMIEKCPDLEPLISNSKKPISIWQKIIYTMNELQLMEKYIYQSPIVQWYEPIDYNLPIPDYNLLKK